MMTGDSRAGPDLYGGPDGGGGSSGGGARGTPEGVGAVSSWASRSRPDAWAPAGGIDGLAIGSSGDLAAGGRGVGDRRFLGGGGRATRSERGDHQDDERDGARARTRSGDGGGAWSGQRGTRARHCRSARRPRRNVSAITVPSLGAAKRRARTRRRPGRLLVSF